MSANIISSSDADLVLHKWVTEHVPVIVWFVSADKSVRLKLTGFANSFTGDLGLVFTTESLYKPASENLTHVSFLGITSSKCEYSDATVSPDPAVGSGLRLTLPNGDTLTILEKLSPAK
jgi:hypothetical protein